MINQVLDQWTVVAGYWDVLYGLGLKEHIKLMLAHVLTGLPNSGITLCIRLGPEALPNPLTARLSNSVRNQALGAPMVSEAHSAYYRYHGELTWI